MFKFSVRNNTSVNLELKDFGLIIPGNKITELDYNQALESTELYNYLSGETLSRIISNCK